MIRRRGIELYGRMKKSPDDSHIASHIELRMVWKYLALSLALYFEKGYILTKSDRLLPPSKLIKDA